jgi:hypothetical protein
MMNAIDPGHGSQAGHPLATALCTPAGFRTESAHRPLVYGYIRSSRQRQPHITVLHRALNTYCRRERLRLCTIFADLDVADDAARRPGLTGLCDVLRLPDSFAAVLISAKQLSPNSHIAENLAQQIRGTGARLLFVLPDTTTAAAGPATGLCAQLPQWWQ